MTYFLYILRSQIKESYYIGISKNVRKRCYFHNHDAKGYTRRYRPWEIVFSKEFSTKKQALNAEQKVKNWKSKKMTRYLVEGTIDLDNYLP